MKKLANGILIAIGLVGGFLVSEGLITGEELSAIQNVTGMALGGGAISIGLIIAIINALPKQLVDEGYKKAVATYGQAKVDGVINKMDDVVTLLNTVNSKLDKLQADVDENTEIRNNLLNG